MFRTATIIALAGLVSAQWVPDLHLFESQESQFFTRLQLSDSCLSALTGIAANQDANSCLSPTTLLPLVTDNSTSIVGPITNWTQNICSAAPCSNDTLASVVSSLTSGCQADITGNDTSVDPSTLASTITPYVQRYYPTVRSIVCLQEWARFINMWLLPLTVNFSNGTNCLASTLNDIQSVSGPLTLNSLIQLVTLGNVPNIPSNVTCSDCTKAAYNILRSDVPSIVSDTSGELQQQCGANFTGKTTMRMDEMKINDCRNSFRH